MIRGKVNWKKNAPNVEVRLSVKKILLPVGALVYQNYQRMRSAMMIVCVKTVFQKNIEKNS